jgi:pyridoxal biosynthesis lyase PdxS
MNKSCVIFLSSHISLFVGIFKSGDPKKRARAIVMAVTHYNNPKILAEVSEDLGEAMVGLNTDQIVTKWSIREKN